MYIQITTRCNMSCEHCCYSCTAEGEDMSLRVFRAAVAASDMSITLGGGEPTLHKQFEKFLLLAMSAPGIEACGVMVITNGTHAERTRMLFGLAKCGAIAADLSLDCYHDPIDEEVEWQWREEAERVRLEHNRYREISEPSRVGIRNTTEHHEPMANGRATTVLGIEKGDDYRCPCDGPICKPNGDVYACGCDDAVKLGHIIDGWEMPDSDSGYFDSYCSRDISERVTA